MCTSVASIFTESDILCGREECNTRRPFLQTPRDSIPRLGICSRLQPRHSFCFPISAQLTPESTAGEIGSLTHRNQPVFRWTGGANKSCVRKSLQSGVLSDGEYAGPCLAGRANTSR